MSFLRIAAAALAFAAMCSSAAAADDEPLLVARLPEGREVPLVLLSTDGEGTVRLLTWKRGAQERRQWLAMPASALESVELSLPDGSPFEGGAVKLVRSDVSVRMGPDDLFLNDQGGTRPLALYVSDESFEEHVVLSIPEAGVTFPSPPGPGAATRPRRRRRQPAATPRSPRRWKGRTQRSSRATATSRARSPS